MKKYIQLTLASFIAVVSLAVVVPQPTQAIDVFSGACGGDSGADTGAGEGAGQGIGQGDAATEGEGAAEGDTEGAATTGGSSSSICGAAKQDDAQDIIKNVINAILVVLGMVAVIMIVIGGIRYTTSNGDASGIKGAKDTILYAVIGLVVAILSYAIVGLAAIPLAPSAVAAPVDSIKEGVGGIGGGEAQPKLEDGLKTIVNVLLFVIGAVAVIMIIIGGLRYTTSNGDASAIKGAKDTILYAVIGIIVAILAYAIVNFVVGAF